MDGRRPASIHTVMTSSASAVPLAPRSVRASAAHADGAVAPRQLHVGHGRRLSEAIAELEALPALAQSRSRALALVADGGCAHEIVAAAESDLALTIAVMRVANHAGVGARGTIDSVVAAVERLSPQGVQGIVARAPTFDFFARTTRWDALAERSRRHAVAAQRAAGVIACEIGYEHRDRLMVTSLLHDIGTLVLTRAYPGYPGGVHRQARTPEERIERERDVLGVDHAAVGGVLARRWGLPATIAAVIERHHAADAAGEAAIVRLADMLAHYQHGTAVSPAAMLGVARALHMDPAALRRVMYELPTGGFVRGRFPESCPLSRREQDLLRRIAEGRVSKEVALDLALSASTVRTHLHNIYAKLGVTDRAKAVIYAAERGWV